MSFYPVPKSSDPRKINSDKRKKLKNSTSVITVRIDEELNNNIDKIRRKMGISKADFIRNYLELSKFIVKQKGSIKSLNDRDFIIVKRSYLRKLIENESEEEQINLGSKLANFINDIARINGKLDDIEYKLDLCDNLGFFPKFIDDEGYILLTKKFGPQKFIEAFIWRIYNPTTDFNTDWVSSKIEAQSKIRTAYNNKVQPVERSSSHSSFEFAKIHKEETE
ncbi:MAG: ribbon-helix-helix protein, CopG family [Candidatus Hodarchaeota archaeon]